MKNRYARFALFLITLSSCHHGYSQAGEWTWMKGDSVPDSYGNYGTLGVPDSTNEPPARYACGYWTDTAGDFWVYGGIAEYLDNGIGDGLSDLWQFNPQTLMWTCIAGNGGEYHSNKGIYSMTNTPGPLGYGMFTWVTPDNHLWLFGGDKPDSGGVSSNDLWQYNPVINQWAWMGVFGPINFGIKGIGDSTTMPGGRQEGNCAWIDSSGNLWLFGGGTIEGSIIFSGNDIWEYNVGSGIWTWWSGSTNGTGIYGTIGQPSDTIYPTGRMTNLFWKDDEGNFWLSGGWQEVFNSYQDIWKFNPRTLQWTWVKGSSIPDTTSLGSDCLPNLNNEEGGRYENRAIWKICDDLIITYGGYNPSIWVNYIMPNDLWAYRISLNEWVKINSWDSVGYYGVKGIANPLNYPPERAGSVGFKDKQNNLWMFSGQNFDYALYYNDLWKYVLDTTCDAVSCSRSCNLAPPVISTSMEVICANDSAQICTSTGFSSYQWNAGVTGTGNCIYAKQAGNYYVTVTDANGCTAESNHLSVSVYPVPSVSIIQQGDTLSSYGAVTYQWYFNNNAIPNASNPVYIAKEKGSYSVQVTDTNGCSAISNPLDVTGVNDLEEEHVQLYPNPNSTGNWHLIVNNTLLGSRIDVYDSEGRIVFKSAINNPQSTIKLDVSSGVYWLQISSPNAIITRKLIRL